MVVVARLIWLGMCRGVKVTVAVPVVTSSLTSTTSLYWIPARNRPSVGMDTRVDELVPPISIGPASWVEP